MSLTLGQWIGVSMMAVLVLGVIGIAALVTVMDSGWRGLAWVVGFLTVLVGYVVTALYLTRGLIQ